MADVYLGTFPLPSSLTQNLALASRTGRFKRRVLSHSFRRTLDRVNVLGDDYSYGHTKCVNALSWARDGELLLSGGDDTTVRIWRMDPSDTSQAYPFVCTSVIHTGHRANIFNAHMLPFSSRIATVAGDKQVRVFDIGEAPTLSIRHETKHNTRESCIHVLRCHKDRVKRIVTEDSPDLFLSVGEDGCVRQHDLRMSHSCDAKSCPPPLVKLHHELSTLALSPLTPYQFVVAGDSPFGYLFDRRHAGRFLQEEWGNIPGAAKNDVTTCVRRFGRPARAPGERPRSEHITGARISAYNGHEVLLSYSADAVYLYSTRDEPKPDEPSTQTGILASNAKRRRLDASDESPIIGAKPGTIEVQTTEDENEDEDEDEADSDLLGSFSSWGDMEFSPEDDDSYQHDIEVEDFDDDDGQDEDDSSHHYFKVPVIRPRLRFPGACNVETVKDVNFLGPEDEYVTSGSDDGNFFIWRKATGALHDIFEGDSSVVNVIEGHPHLPLVAVSGIDSTIKLFAPVNGFSTFSKMHSAKAIMELNAQNSRTRRIDVNHLLWQRLAMVRRAIVTDDGEGGETQPQCAYQ